MRDRDRDRDVTGFLRGSILNFGNGAYERHLETGLIHLTRRWCVCVTPAHGEKCDHSITLIHFG